MPPAKVLIAAVVDELEIVAHAHRRAIDLKIFEPNFVRRLFVVPGERWERRHLMERPHPCGRVTGILAGAFCTLPHGRATAPPRVPKLKQPTLDLNHSAHAFDR